MSFSLTKLRELASLCKITNHEDYRGYLEAIYRLAKESASEYSYAHFSINLGLSSTNAHAIIAGHRNLSLKTGNRIATALGLTEHNKRYLLALIRQEHAKSHAEREEAFLERMQLARSALSSSVDERRLKFFESWHHAAILEILRLENASDDPQWLSDNLRPSVSIPKIKQSLELLKNLGYLAPSDKFRRLYPTEVLISTGDQVERLAILSYHRQMLHLAIAAMDKIDAEDRDIAAITIGVSGKLKSQIRDEVIKLRKRFLELAKNENSPDEILQLNVQLFPISKRLKK
jgi:uncharacterized protein (TIGR02147 family)